VEFQPGNVTAATLFAADGSTVLATVSHTWPDSVVGGIAIRTFGDIIVDTLRVCF